MAQRAAFVGIVSSFSSSSSSFSSSSPSRRQVCAITWVRSRPDTRRHIWMFSAALPAIFRCRLDASFALSSITDKRCCYALLLMSKMDKQKYFCLEFFYCLNKFLWDACNIYFNPILISCIRNVIYDKRLRFLLVQMRITCWRLLCRIRKPYSSAKIIRLCECVFVV